MTLLKSQSRVSSLCSGVVIASLLCTGAVFVAGCDNSSDGTMEEAGEAIDDAMKDAGDAMEDAADDLDN